MITCPLGCVVIGGGGGGGDGCSTGEMLCLTVECRFDSVLPEGDDLIGQPSMTLAEISTPKHMGIRLFHRSSDD